MHTYTVKNNILFFWGGPFSQWSKKSKFKIHNSDWRNIFEHCEFAHSIEFASTEQAMMFGKAIVFSDLETAEKILKTDDPKEQKALGRLVKNFNDAEWDKVKFRLVTMINTAKFAQSESLRKFLLDTGHNIICEASPVDKIWGIGLSEDNPLAWDTNTWKGENLLGRALMQVRENLRNP